ncbi:type VI secretion system baseplate subunit TssF [Aquabacterium sp.]|uniref:type VI secretion system baseplate subunit TssF n=1 Tax=Aquabacterium sp. TaxID=1872578 RepID=UPI002BDFC8B7|nr:type VI secretion system baseplate subunit TssF [Aquabacterium sp.]HSW03539.1 type VI secretion system baseplate subunit TssF [Aquabacterium sp.]
MADALLPYYDRELAAIRKLAGEFATANPKVAGRLRITADAVDDPHVERLLEGVAFLAARVQHRLDDDSPELSDALLELLCPHLLAPVPSLTTVQLRAKPEATGPSRVARGTPLLTQPVRGEALQYQTCHETVLWPVAIDKARLAGLPLPAPPNPHAPRAAAVLRLSLVTTVPGLGFIDLGLDRLRLHLRGTGPTATQLLELLCTSTLSIALADGPADPRPTFLPREALAQVGFESHEAALPWPQRAFSGHRLLTEYFAFPEKFLYIELSGLEARSMVHPGSALEVYIYLSRTSGDLERSVSEDNFVLGATPVVNLFDHPAEPVAMDGTQSEWLVVPDARRPAALEVYAVEGVRFSRPDAPQPRKVPHFQRLKHEEGAEEDADGLSWLASRRAAPAILGGTETRLMLRDPQFDPALPADGVLSIDTLCCNRDLPSLLPFGGGQPTMRITDPAAPAGGVECLAPPTATLRPQLRERSGWRLVSHLALNHLGVTGGPQAAMALREMLRLHDLRDTPETRLALDGIVSVNATPGVARLPDARPGSFARGIDLALTFEPQAWTAGGLYLLAGVLERFFALQVSINGFVRTSVYLRGRSGSVATWPARSGTRVLL